MLRVFSGRGGGSHGRTEPLRLQRPRRARPSPGPPAPGRRPGGAVRARGRRHAKPGRLRREGLRVVPGLAEALRSPAIGTVKALPNSSCRAATRAAAIHELRPRCSRPQANFAPARRAARRGADAARSPRSRRRRRHPGTRRAAPRPARTAAPAPRGPHALADTLRNAPVPIESIEYAVLVRRSTPSTRTTAPSSGSTAVDSHELIGQLQRPPDPPRPQRDTPSWHRTPIAVHCEHVAISATERDAARPEQKAFKKAYAAGRRELEHEFGKIMRYKSIRDLAAGRAGLVVADLKPIWLMSPLSVSDTLPLDPDLFDVVIFDEASQIPLEEAVPALYRAPQVIVVGDQMQLPPTQFFCRQRKGRRRRSSAEEDGETDRRHARRATASSPSRAPTCPSTMLAWHYRSRSESLIGFSNAAFYDGRLRTVPDRQLHRRRAPPRSMRRLDRAVHRRRRCAALDRSISFHHLTDARLRATPQSGGGRATSPRWSADCSDARRQTIGIVAFSEAQQSEIEEALDALACERSRVRGPLRSGAGARGRRPVLSACSSRTSRTSRATNATSSS